MTEATREEALVLHHGELQVNFPLVTMKLSNAHYHNYRDSIRYSACNNTITATQLHFDLVPER